MRRIMFTSFTSRMIIIGLAVLIGLGYWLWKRRPTEGKVHALGRLPPFTIDLTDAARNGALNKVVGMEDVVERLIHVLLRKNKNNPLLIGEPGVGKTAAVERLTLRIVEGSVPARLKNMRVFALNLSDMMAGTKYRGDLESRLQGMLKDFEKHKKDYLLFIDELQMIEQARGGEGSLDLADILKPALSRGEIQVIGATTWKEYLRDLKPDATVERRFQPVLVQEPDKKDTLEILKGVKDTYEKFHGVILPEKTLKAAIDASVRFIKERNLPDKAFDVIDEACAMVSVAKRPGRSKKKPTVTVDDVEAIIKQWRHHHASIKK